MGLGILIVMASALIGGAACRSKRNKATSESVTGFVKADSSGFTIDGKPYNFVGTNFWYGPILASEGVGGDSARLTQELDRLKSLGLTNLRVLVGGDGPEGLPAHIRPALQVRPGEYNDTLLRALDRFMAEVDKRDMKAVLYLTNAWEWSGGFSQYLEWAGAGKALIPSVDGYDEYCGYVSDFAVNDKARKMFMDHVRFIVSRTNTVTGRRYADDPAIMAWEVCNEPRPFTMGREERKPLFAQWISQAAALIKELDPNHLVTTGSEGKYGCESDLPLFEKIHADPNIDYVTIHVWPKNWGWIGDGPTDENLSVAIDKSRDYIDQHVEIAHRLGKPLVMEEFGYPRNDMEFRPGTSVALRDRYYDAMLDLARSRSLAGVNIWGWAGSAMPRHAVTPGTNLFWSPGDDYTCDPAHEQQGLYSVFDSDTTTVTLLSRAATQPK